MKIYRERLKQLITLVAIIAAFGMNIWANIAPPNGMTIGEISNNIFGNVLITPANYAFAIWGLIYLGLIGFAIYQALPSQENNLLVRPIRLLLTVASGAQIIWIFFFLYRQFALSFLAMLAILISLIIAYQHLKSHARTTSRQQKWLIRIPISIYTAWISVATIVNGATVLEYWNWNGWGISPQVWTMIMLFVASVIGGVIAMKRDIAYVSVFIWALVAIAVRNWQTLGISGLAIGMAIALAFILIICLLRQSQSSKSSEFL